MPLLHRKENRIDGSFTTSECGAAYNGKPFSRTFTAEQAKQLQFIHY